MMHVYCSRCERKVELKAEHLTPTLPPMIPTVYPSQEFYLREIVGHVCNEYDVQARLIADLAKVKGDQ